MSRTTDRRIHQQPTNSEPGDPYEPAVIWPAQIHWVAAYHEAGHCVAYWYYRLPFTRVVIRKDGTGAVLGGPPAASAAAQAICALAGPAAEARYTGTALPAVLRNEYGDRQRAVAALHRAAAGGLTMAALADQATDLVAMRWADIEAVAAALLAREALSYEEVLIILGK